MNLLFVTVSIKVVSTFVLCLVYFYLYSQYKERYMGLWSVSWALFSLRVVLDLARYNGFENIALLLVNQISSVASIIFLLMGTYEFASRKMNRWWIYCAIIATIFTDICLAFKIPLELSGIPTALFFAMADIWTGMIILRFWSYNCIGKTITGFALIILGILNSTYPLGVFFSANLKALCFFLGTVLELTIIVGTLVIYFQKIRSDLTASEQRFRLLADNAKDIIYRFKVYPKLKCDYVSPAVSNITGYHPSDFYNEPELFNKIIHPDDAIYLKKITTPNGHDNSLILRLVNKEQKEIWTEQHYVPFFDHSHNLVAVEGIIRDITERKRLEAELAKLDRLNVVGEMAAGISHEIRNPMQVVRGFLQLLQDKDDCFGYHEYFELMINELDRANSIITEFLAMAKNKAINLTKQSLNRIIENTYPLILADATIQDKIVVLDLQDLPDVMVDEQEIRQMLLNLARNGLEAMQAGGTLRLSTFLRNEEIVMVVSDEGKGMSIEVMEKLGTPFLTTKEDGVGLGLAICYSIAKRHQAKIHVNSTSMGTSFEICFKNADNYNQPAL